MKRLLSVTFALIFSVSLFCAPFVNSSYAASSSLAPSPSFTIENNTLLLSRQTITAYEGLAYFAGHVPKAQISSIDFAKLDDAEYFANIKINLNPTNMKYGCMRSGSAITISDGDMLCFASRSSGGVRNSEWLFLLVSESMFKGAVPGGGSSGGTSNVSVSLFMTETALIIQAEDKAQVWEYAVVEPNSTSVTWKKVDVSYDSSIKGYTIPIRPRSTSCKYRVRRELPYPTASFSYLEIDNIPVTSPKVFLDLELLGPFTGGENGKKWYVSYNDGGKWQIVNVPAGTERLIDLSRVFGKKEVAVIVREAVEEKSPDELSNVYYGVYNPRPVFPKGIKTAPMSGNEYALNYSFTGYEPTDKYQVRMETGQTSWLPMDFEVGLKLLTVAEMTAGKKPVKTYLRIPCDEKTSTPASLSKKYTQMKQIKAPSVKPDYKTETIKAKAGMFYCAINPDEDPTVQTYTASSGGGDDISQFITDKKVLYVYIGETDKKPRSAVQKITLAERYVKPDAGEGYTNINGKVKIVKGYEVLPSSGGSWGGFKKDTSYSLRRKTDAKYNPKAATTTGKAASLATTIEITYDGTGKIAETVTMPSKPVIPLTSLSITIPKDGNASVAYGNPSALYEDGVMNYYLAKTQLLDSKNYPLPSKFTFSFKEKPDDLGKSLIKKVTFSQNGTEITPESNGSYSCTNAALDDVFTLTLTPTDPNTYKTTSYRVYIIEPLLPSPTKAAFSTVSGERGSVTVTMPYALRSGGEITLTAELYKVDSFGEKQVAEKTLSFAFDEDKPSNNNNFVFKFHEEISAVGKGIYRVKVYVKGEKGSYSNSEKTVTGDLEISAADLKLCVVKTDTSVAGVVRIADAFDLVGNSLMSEVTFQWLRSETAAISETNRGTSVAANSSTFSTEGSEGYYIGVRVTAAGVSKYVSFGFINRTITLTAPTVDLIDNTDGNTAVTLRFVTSGLDAKTQLTLTADNANISAAAEVTGDSLVIDDVTIDNVEGAVIVTLTAVSDGLSSVTVTLTIGSSVFGYNKTPSPNATAGVTVLMTP